MCASVSMYAACVLLEVRSDRNHKDGWLKPSFSHIHRALNTEWENKSQRECGGVCLWLRHQASWSRTIKLEASPCFRVRTYFSKKIGYRPMATCPCFPFKPQDVIWLLSFCFSACGAGDRAQSLAHAGQWSTCNCTMPLSLMGSMQLQTFISCSLLFIWG